MTYVLLLLSATAFGLGIVAAKPALARLSLSQFLLCRCSVGTLGALCFWQGASLTIPSEHLGLVLLSLFLCPLLINVVFFASMRFGSLSISNSIRYSAPLWLMLIVYLWRGDVPNGMECVSGVSIAGGVCLLVSGAALNRSVVLAALSAALQGGTVLVQQQVLEVMSVRALLLYQNLSFLLSVVLFMVVAPRLGFAAQSETQGQGSSVRQPSGFKPWALAGLSGFLAFVVGEGLKFLALPNCDPYVASALMQLSLPVSLFGAVLVLGERIDRKQLIALLCISLGSILAPLAKL